MILYLKMIIGHCEDREMMVLDHVFSQISIYVRMVLRKILNTRFLLIDKANILTFQH